MKAARDIIGDFLKSCIFHSCKRVEFTYLAYDTHSESQLKIRESDAFIYYYPSTTINISSVLIIIGEYYLIF